MAGTKLRRAHGNWVSGDRFWDRETELEVLGDYLEEGAHLLIVAQRRIGKTSLMHEAMRRLGDRFLCLFVDLEKSHSAADAIVALSVRGHAELSHLEERLKMVLGPDRHPLALDLLTEAAVTGELTASAALTIASEYVPAATKPAKEIRELLGILEHDGYLKRNGEESYVFVSKLLRDWWKARFGFGFIVARQRS